MPRPFTRDYEWRATELDTGDGHTLIGYAAVFSVDAEIRSAYEGTFIERITKGAFKKTLREHPHVQMQYDHGRDSRVGSVPIGVYEEIREDEHGLHVRGRIFDNDLAEPIRQAIEAGAIRGMSIRMSVIQDEWRDSAGRILRSHEVDRLRFEPGSRGPIQRAIKEIRLHEAGPVSSPAYQTTSVGVRGTDRRNTIPADVRLRLLKMKGNSHE